MEIVVDSSVGRLSFGTEEVEDGWVCKYLGYIIISRNPSSDVDATGVHRKQGLELTLYPLPGREEVVERFVAIGKLQNANFPFRVKEEEDADRD